LRFDADRVMACVSKMSLSRALWSTLSVLVLAPGFGVGCASRAARQDAGTASPQTADAHAFEQLDSSPAQQPDIQDSAVDTQPLGCQSTRPIRCGERVTHDTRVEGQADALRGYGCTQRALTGRETIYAFRTREACRVSARLDALQSDLDLFALDDCDPSSCKQASSTPRDLQIGEQLVFDAAASSTHVLVVDGYAGSAGTYDLVVDCLCGAASASFEDGPWRLEVDRRWQGDPARIGAPSMELMEGDYAPVTGVAAHAIVVSKRLREVSIGTAPWRGTIAQGSPGSLRYELSTGTFAGGRWIVWNTARGLEAELTLYGSGVPIVSSERGRLVRAPVEQQP
jgi:hypothetical protein